MNVLLLEPEAHHCQWAATVNSKGGLFQENRNCEIKKLIKSMGVNKTHKGISITSKASDGGMKVVEVFENQVSMPKRSTSHTLKSAKNDEQLILTESSQPIF